MLPGARGSVPLQFFLHEIAEICVHLRLPASHSVFIADFLFTIPLQLINVLCLDEKECSCKLGPSFRRRKILDKGRLERRG